MGWCNSPVKVREVCIRVFFFFFFFFFNLSQSSSRANSSFLFVLIMEGQRCFGGDSKCPQMQQILTVK